MSIFTVVSSDSKGLARRATLEDRNGGRVLLSFQRFAQIGKDDRVFIHPEHTSKIYVVSTENPDDKIRVTPYFEQLGALRIGSENLPIRITEIVTQEDLDSYNYLEAFHYRTSNITSDREGDEDEAPAMHSMGGRRAVLLCSVRVGAKWQPVGYLELQMPLLMVKPRHELFDLPFKHPTRPIEWSKWDMHSIRESVNCIVRIARMVTSPEYRGLGLSRFLIQSGKDFAKERWHIRGRRPLFIEISAEMLKYLDFVSSSGFIFAGNTEGNLSRVHKDLTYMQREYAAGSGIMSLQKKYLLKLRRGADDLGRTFDSMLDLLKEVTNDPERMKNLEPSEYYYLKSVLRFPIPYYIGGLDEPSEQYLHKAIRRIEEISPEKIKKPNPSKELTIKSGRINYTNISVSTNYRLPNSKHVKAIMDCFGIEGETLSSRIITGLQMEASGGNTIFISGPSGAGKSLLLRALDVDACSPYVTFHRDSPGRERYSVGWIRDLPSDVPLIELFASRWGMERSLAALNQAGLSEAYVYLKPYDLLSRGQKYRARLADLALRDDQVWLIDEFCADLDPISAKIVATNLRKHVMKYQRIAVVAAANHDHFLDALRPTRVICLRQGFAPEFLTYREYVDEFHSKVG